MEDIRIGRKASGRVTVVAAPIGASQLTASDPLRIRLLIGAADGSDLWVSDKPMTGTNQGVLIRPASGEIGQFNVEDEGSFVMGEIFCWSVAGANVAILETSLTDQ